MNATDSIFKNALCKLLTEIFDGPPGNEAYLLNPGDPGLLRQLDSIDAGSCLDATDARKNDDRRARRSRALRIHADEPLGGGRTEPLGRRRLERQLATNSRHRRSVAIAARPSSSRCRHLARGRRRPHRLGRHDRRRRALQRRPYGISLGRDPANPRGHGMTAGRSKISRVESMKSCTIRMLVLLAVVCAGAFVAGQPRDASATPPGVVIDTKHGYAPVNGLKMYYEIHGDARAETPPLVLLHGGGSTIETTFGKILPALAKSRQVIAFEQQGHGRTADIADRPFTFEQSADDAAALLEHLKIEKADFFGFSNGGNIALQIAIRHPKLVRKLVVASADVQTRRASIPRSGSS